MEKSEINGRLGAVLSDGKRILKRILRLRWKGVETICLVKEMEKMVGCCEHDNELPTCIKWGENFLARCTQIHLSVRLCSMQLVSEQHKATSINYETPH